MRNESSASRVSILSFMLSRNTSAIMILAFFVHLVG